MNRKIWKALGIAVCMLALAAPRAMAVKREVRSDDDFKKAVEEINKSGDEENEIILDDEVITLEGDTTEYTLRRGRTTIKGGGHKITIKSKAEIKVTGGETVLNLGVNGYDKKLTIDGDTTAAFIVVSGGATANMNENVTLQNRMFTGNAYVLVTGSKSVFNMKGGVIEGGSRAVIAQSGATFNMSGGEIRNCNGGSGNGGGAHVYGATFVMSGGTISGCTGLRGGGLYANNSTVTITDGTISGCKVGAGGGLFATNSSKITIRGGTISECSTTLDSGKGGGLYAENSTITISGGTIENNEAARGGGVALTDSTVTDEQPIRNWMVVGNKAYKTGGGIWLGEKVEWDISDRTKQIYNNQAIEQGADIFLEGGTSAIKLPNAANMGAKYHDSGINIDNWYNDNPRYTPSENGQVVKANKWLNGGLSLVASYKADPVRIEIDANGGVGGSISQTVQKGTTVTLEAPTKEGYLFKGWKDEKGNSYPAGEDGKVKITVTGAMTLKAVWEARSFTVTYVLLDGKTRTETAAYGQNVTLGEEPRTGYTFVGWKDGEKVYRAGETITVTGDMTLTAEWKKLPSAENLPKTGDESPVLLWGAVLAVSAAACFMLRRKK